MSPAALRCRDLLVRRSAGFELRVPLLEVGSGSVTAVCGANGSGKSTLLLACAGLIDIDGGRVELADGSFHEGRAPAPTERRRAVVLVPQDPYLLKGSARRNLCWGLGLRRVPKREQQQRITEVLAALGIAELAERDVGRLSGGQRTLVAVARALVLRPALLLLDEVTRDLDEEHRLAVIEAVRAQVSRPGAVALLATHDQELVELLASRRVELVDGQIASGQDRSTEK